jgi:hypothetical protein
MTLEESRPLTKLGYLPGFTPSDSESAISGVKFELLVDSVGLYRRKCCLRRSVNAQRPQADLHWVLR